MFDVGGGELILIVLAIIVLFGPKKLPEIAQMFGKGLSHLRKAQSEIQSHLTDIKSEVQSHVNIVEEAVQESPKPSQVRQPLPIEKPLEVSVPKSKEEYLASLENDNSTTKDTNQSDA